MVKPKKHLGQHFLIQNDIAKKIADLVVSQTDNTIIEIGSGTGALTKHLLQTNFNRLICNEIDSESIVFLKENYKGAPLEFCEESFLSIHFEQLKLPVEKTIIIGNFPYNISSQIVFKTLENKNYISQFIGMFQKEVAKRICSPHDNKTYGILSVLCQTYFKTTLLFDVAPGNFNPPPKVMSTVIEMTPIIPTPHIDYAQLKMLVKMAFNQRRKTLKNALSALNINWEGEIAAFAGKRAEQLSVKEFHQLAEAIKSSI